MKLIRPRSLVPPIVSERAQGLQAGVHHSTVELELPRSERRFDLPHAFAPKAVRPGARLSDCPIWLQEAKRGFRSIRMSLAALEDSAALSGIYLL